MRRKPWYSSYQKWFYVILSGSWITGIVFFIFNNFVEVEGEFGIEKHFLQYPVLKTHGAFAFFIMVMYGFYLGAHVKKTWKVKKRPMSGYVILLLPIFLIISGWFLYYVATDNARYILGLIHFAVGALLPVALILHIKDVSSKKGKIKYRYR